MNVLSIFTRRNMIARKRRTFLTFMGVALSVAMIFAVSTILGSYMERGRRRNLATLGKWTASFQNISLFEIQSIKEAFPNDKSSVVQDVGFAKLPNNRRPDKPYLFIQEYSKEAMATLNVTLSEGPGRLPENPSEILVPYDLSDFSDQTFTLGETYRWDIGDRVLEDGRRVAQLAPLDSSEKLQNTENKNYTIVGFIEHSITELPDASYFNCISILSNEQNSLLDQPESLTPENDFRGTLYMYSTSPPADYSDQIDQLCTNLGISANARQINTHLLSYYTQFAFASRNNNFILSLVILCAILICVIILIYNAFSISSAARRAQQGLLGTIGATHGQKRSTVYKEGLYACVFGVPTGVVLGLLGIYALRIAMDRFQSASYAEFPFVFEFSPVSIFLAGILSVISIFATLMVPAARASSVLPLDAIRPTHLTVKKIRSRKYFGWLRIFKIEGVLAQENIRCSGKQKRTLLLSLSVGLILFLSISYYIFRFFQNPNDVQAAASADIKVNVDSTYMTSEEKKDLLIKIQNLENTNQVMLMNRIEGIFLPASELSKLTGLTYENEEDIGSIANRNRSIMYAIDDAAYTNYLTEQLQENPAYYLKKPICVLLPKIAIRDSYKDKESDRDVFFPITSVFPKGIDEWENIKNIQLDKDSFISPANIPADMSIKLTIGKVASGYPDFLLSDPLYQTSIIFSHSYIDEALSSEVNREITEIFINGINHKELENDLRELLKNIKVTSFVNNIENREVSKDRDSISDLLSLVFLLLIGLLVISNSLNSLSTSLELRRREFSMLRSVGMTPDSFRKMLFFEGLYYSLTSIITGIFFSLIINIALFFFEEFIVFFRKNNGIGARLVWDSELISSFLRNEANFADFWSTMPLSPYLYGILAIFFCVFFSQFLAVRHMGNQNMIDIMKDRTI